MSDEDQVSEDSTYTVTGDELISDAARDARTSADQTAIGGEERFGDRESVERDASSFLELESAFPSETEGREPVYGRAVSIDRVDASEVPADYPCAIETDTAVALAVEPDVAPDERTVCYFAWPEPDVETRFTRLLELLGVPQERLADLHGERLLLSVEDGYFVPYVPRDGPRGDDRGRLGIYLGLGANALAVALWVAGLGGLLASGPAVLALLVCNLVALPIGTFLDAWHLRTHTDWDQSPGVWAILAALVGLNVVSSLLYLYTKRSARSIGG